MRNEKISAQHIYLRLATRQVICSALEGKIKIQAITCPLLNNTLANNIPKLLSTKARMILHWGP